MEIFDTIGMVLVAVLLITTVIVSIIVTISLFIDLRETLEKRKRTKRREKFFSQIEKLVETGEVNPLKQTDKPTQHTL